MTDPNYWLAAWLARVDDYGKGWCKFDGMLTRDVLNDIADDLEAK